MSESGRNPTDLRGERQAQLEAQKAAERARELEIADIKWAMSNPAGRRILWRLLSRAGVFQTTFRLNNEMAFLEGRRSLGLEFLGDIQGYALKEFVNMLEERTRE